MEGFKFPFILSMAVEKKNILITGIHTVAYNLPSSNVVPSNIIALALTIVIA